MSARDESQGWESLGRIAVPTGTVAFADMQVLGEGFVLRPELVVSKGSVEGMEGSITMHAAPDDRPLLVERYFDDRGTVSAARVALSETYETETEKAEESGEWEEMGILSLMLGACMACDPRRPGSEHRLPFRLRSGRYLVERLVGPAADEGAEDESEGEPEVRALRIRIQGHRKPSLQRRPATDS